MKFVQARWFHAGGNSPVNRVVLHDAEYPEKLTGAEDIAAYFARTDRKASAHYVCDADSTVQCVKNGDIAFHAPPNTGSIGIEQCGYAKQTLTDWLDDYGTHMIRDQVVPLVDLLCREYDLPHVWLSVQDLRDGKRGITSHNNVSLAFGQSTHTDPGKNYPVEQFMAWLTPPPPGDDDMRPVPYRTRNDDGSNVSTAIFLTSDFTTTRTLSEPAWIHGGNLGWWPKTEPIQIPVSLHNWMAQNSKGQNIP